jgi:hypothetical protein
MGIEKQLIADLYDVVRSQQKLISFLVVNGEALLEALATDPALPDFLDSFDRKQVLARTQPEGQVAEVLDLMEHMLDAIGKRLKRDSGGWHN